jgi:hypothetical protein
MPKFDPAVSIGYVSILCLSFRLGTKERLTITSPFKGGQSIGVTLSYLQASRLKQPLKIHPLLECKTWDPSTSPHHCLPSLILYDATSRAEIADP